MTVSRTQKNKDVVFKLESATICVVAISGHGSRSCVRKSHKKSEWKAASVENVKFNGWFFLFYERHVFAYDIFEIQFGTCSLPPSRKKMNAASFRWYYASRSQRWLFLLRRLVFISLLAAWNKKEKTNFNENIRRFAIGDSACIREHNNSSGE